MTFQTSTPARRPILGLVSWLALSFGASLTAVFVSTDGWYAHLNKPLWNPPSWVFGPVWAVLYGMMGVAAWLVWCDGGWKRQPRALSWFVVQWALNALWTPLFFGLHLSGWAFFEMMMLWLALGVTLALFWRVRRVAGILLIPYWLWVSFAAVLNFTLWRLNE